MSIPSSGEGGAEKLLHAELDNTLMEIKQIIEQATRGFHSGSAETIMTLNGYRGYSSFDEFLSRLESYGQSLDPKRQNRQKAAVDLVLSKKDLFLKAERLEKDLGLKSEYPPDTTSSPGEPEPDEAPGYLLSEEEKAGQPRPEYRPLVDAHEIAFEDRNIAKSAAIRELKRLQKNLAPLLPPLLKGTLEPGGHAEALRNAYVAEIEEVYQRFPELKPKSKTE